MWTGVIIVANPLTQNGSQMFLTKWDHEVQTLPSHRSNQSLTVGVGLRCSDRSAQDFQPKILNRLIDLTWEETLRGPELIPSGQYFFTVRGETKIPSLSDNSSATRSCPQVGLSIAISAINFCIFLGSRGLPPRDFQRQNS